MNKKEDFKTFARQHPELVTYVKSGEMNWQKFFEIYDIYGEEESAWKEYIGSTNRQKDTTDSVSEGISGFAEKFKNIDMNSIQEHIKTAQKALNLVQELTAKGAEGVGSLAKGPQIPRPLNKFFED